MADKRLGLFQNMHRRGEPVDLCTNVKTAVSSLGVLQIYIDSLVSGNLLTVKLLQSSKKTVR
jgi:hypothetical protein